MIPLTDYAGATQGYREAVQHLSREYLAQKEADGTEEFTLRHPRSGEMRWEPFEYFPEAHFRQAYDKVRTAYWPEVRTDGGYADLHSGKRKATVYYWLDPDTGAALYHTGVNDEETIPFFPEEEAAMEYLEKRAEGGDEERYKGLSLYKARTRKVGDGVDVLTDQSGIADFAPDGGMPAPRQQYVEYLRSLAESGDLDTAETYESWLEEELVEMWEEHGSPYFRPDGGMQIENPVPDRVWFWYDPTADYIVQAEIEPYDVRGLFETGKDAERFLGWYADKNDLERTAHFELYSAVISYEGQGTAPLNEAAGGKQAPPAQADLDAYLSHEGEDRNG